MTAQLRAFYCQGSTDGRRRSCQAGQQALGKDLGNLHVWYTDNVVKHHQLQLQIAFLKGDHEAIKTCKALIQSFDG
tara:strand:- start:863 stop:1090 length:228 start_codon:yes stop_codon:yes gene_type:complete